MSKDAYGWVAKWYDSLFNSMNAGLGAIGRKLVQPTEGMSVLDVGCGTGSHLVEYKKVGCIVYGIDMSPAMLEVANTKLGNDAKLHLGDATDMPYDDNMFDLITTTLVLHELSPDTRDAIVKEMKRIVKPDGRILFIDFHPGPIRFPKGWFTKIVITLAEIAAGREHFMNQRQFLASKGLPALIKTHQLKIEKQKIVSGGNMALFLVTV